MDAAGRVSPRHPKLLRTCIVLCFPYRSSLSFFDALLFLVCTFVQYGIPKQKITGNLSYYRVRYVTSIPPIVEVVTSLVATAVPSYIHSTYMCLQPPPRFRHLSQCSDPHPLASRNCAYSCFVWNPPIFSDLYYSSSQALLNPNFLLLRVDLNLQHFYSGINASWPKLRNPVLQQLYHACISPFLSPP